MSRISRVERWSEQNQRYLTAELARLRRVLETRAAPAVDGSESARSAREEPADPPVEMEAPPALESLRQIFGLSPFERDLLLLCAGSSSIPASPRRSPPGGKGGEPDLRVALAALPGAHWSALWPAAPLRRWRMVELESGGSLTAGRLRIDERILHYLVGVQHLDDRLAGWIEPLGPQPEPVPSLVRIADEVVALWSGASEEERPLPAVQLCGDPGGARSIATTVARRLRLDVAALAASTVPTATAELDALIRLWQRESTLGGVVLFVDRHGREGEDGARDAAIERLVERVRGPLLVAGTERRRARYRTLVTFDVPPPTSAEQRDLWQRALGRAAVVLDGQVESLVAQFDLTPAAIAAAGARVRGTGEEDEGEVLLRRLWRACRAQARPRLDDLAQRLRPGAGWDDLVLPPSQERALREIPRHVRHRRTVLQSWGFERKSARGLGINALFAGPSGTGKTLAAEVLAGELDLDLYRIDLSAVVSKYIGETEKNLSRVFDAAEAGGAVLLFDEADALFGRRSEVRDSHDRYANIEVSYLLQRMESYRGLSILTTNLKDALDPAFLRRLRFIVQFPFPDAALRAEIWRRIFPEETPTEDLDPETLARLNVAGGNIRNIALSAAFLAADEGTPVRMAHLLQAARTEYAKIEKSLSDAEIRGWPR